MDFENEADEPAQLVEALKPKCPHATATKVFYKREDSTFLVLCPADGLSSEAHAVPPGFKRVPGVAVEQYTYDKAKARADFDLQAGHKE